MSEAQDPQADLLRRFQDVVEGAGLDELRELTGSLLSLAGARELRAEPQTYARATPTASR